MLTERKLRGHASSLRLGVILEQRKWPEKSESFLSRNVDEWPAEIEGWMTGQPKGE